jgi:hypothetical protein
MLFSTAERLMGYRTAMLVRAGRRRPIGGTATCTMVVELPQGAPAPAVFFNDGRYNALAPIVTD